MAYCKLEAPYPDPEEGQKRVVFVLDPVGDGTDETQDLRLQLIPGRTLSLTKTEAINMRSFDGSIEEHTVDGWGYDYYRVNLSHQAVSTKMMYHGDDDGEKVSKFIPIFKAKLIRYKSSTPIVVYLPEDAELRYSVWTGSNELEAAEE